MPDSVSWRHESYSVRQYSVSICPICDSPLRDPRSAASFRSLQSRRFLTKTRRYIDRGRHLEKQRKRLRGRGGVLNPSTSPLKTLFDSSQLSGSINFQDGGTTSCLKTIHGSRPKIRLLCRLSFRYRNRADSYLWTEALSCHGFSCRCNSNPI